MNFSGWVPIRRGILEHLIDGRLTNNEFIVLEVLTLLADKQTGGYTINKGTLRYYLPGMSNDTADKALRSLQKKGYVFRKIIYKSTAAYPYWINGYELTFGPMKARRLDLSEVLATNDISKLRHMTLGDETAADGAAESAVETAVESADFNNKRKGTRDKRKRQSPIHIERCEHSDLNVRTVNHDSEDICDPGGERSVTKDVTQNVTQARTQGVGLRWSGAEGAYLDKTNRPVPIGEAQRRIGALGLKQEGLGFVDIVTGASMAWKDAQRIIAGTSTEGEMAA